MSCYSLLVAYRSIALLVRLYAWWILHCLVLRLLSDWKPQLFLNVLVIILVLIVYLYDIDHLLAGCLAYQFLLITNLLWQDVVGLDLDDVPGVYSLDGRVFNELVLARDETGLTLCLSHAHVFH